MKPPGNRSAPVWGSSTSPVRRPTGGGPTLIRPETTKGSTMSKGSNAVRLIRYVWSNLTPEQRQQITDNAVNVAKQGGRLVPALNQQRRSNEPTGASPRQNMGETGQDLPERSSRQATDDSADGTGPSNGSSESAGFSSTDDTRGSGFDATSDWNLPTPPVSPVSQEGVSNA
jgi:hypothetical protein